MNRARMECHDCHVRLIDGTPGMWSHGSGWIQHRRDGGAHGVSDWVSDGLVLCDLCKRTRDLHATQPGLF